MSLPPQSFYAGPWSEQDAPVVNMITSVHVSSLAVAEYYFFAFIHGSLSWFWEEPLAPICEEECWVTSPMGEKKQLNLLLTVGVHAPLVVRQWWASFGSQSVGMKRWLCCTTKTFFAVVKHLLTVSSHALPNQTDGERLVLMAQKE